MKINFFVPVLFCVSTFVWTPVQADTIKVGVIGPFSGPYAIFGKQIRDGVETYIKEHKPGNHEVVIIYRDLDSPNPPKAKALAQELLVKEKVQYLGGIVFTPNAATIAPMAEEAKVPFVIFNAAKTGLTKNFQFTARTSYNFAQVTYPAADYTLGKNRKRVVTLVSDYAGGIDAETAFKQRFEKGGGTILESIRIPLKATDFTPFVQRAKAQSPDAIFVFMGAGLPSFGFIKSYAENGLKKSGISFIGTAETDETNLQSLGDAAIGIETSLNYSAAHNSEINKSFKAALKRQSPDAIANVVSVGSYDGMHLIYEMIRATNGKKDGEKAIASIKGFTWESPRGKVQIDPESRDIIQNVYIRTVAKEVSGELQNQELKTFEMQSTYAQ